MRRERRFFLESRAAELAGKRLPLDDHIAYRANEVISIDLCARRIIIALMLIRQRAAGFRRLTEGLTYGAHNQRLISPCNHNGHRPLPPFAVPSFSPNSRLKSRTEYSTSRRVFFTQDPALRVSPGAEEATFADEPSSLEFVFHA